MDDLTSNDDYVLAKEGELYIVYMKMGAKEKTVLNNVKGNYKLQWYNPRTGKFIGSTDQISSNQNLEISVPDSESEKDWVVLVRKA